MAGNPYVTQANAAANKYGVPPSLYRSVINQESGWNPKIKSAAGAVGLVQIHLPSHPDVSLQQAEDPKFALDWGARYLKSMYDSTGSWKLALAAYNAGLGAVKKAGGVPNIPETQRYVTSVLSQAALKRGYPTRTNVALGGDMGATFNGKSNVDLESLALSNLQATARGHQPSPEESLASLTQAVMAAAPSDQPSSPASPATPVDSGTPFTGGYPLATQGTIIGTPYAGTHTDFGNWESDNAIDIKVPKGTPVYATEDGTVGDQIGPLDSGNPQLAGNRLHLVTRGNEFYYAHLARLVVKAGQKVKKGQLLGYSGAANGVQHLHIASKSGNPLDMFGGA